MALHNDKRAIKYIPYDEQTAEMALMAVNGSPHSLRFVAPTLRTCSLYELAVRKNANTLLYVPGLCCTNYGLGISCPYPIMG